MKPVQPSACAWIFVWRASAVEHLADVALRRLEHRKRARPSTRARRTSTRSASSARRLRTTTGSSSRERWSSGEKNQPARWTYDSARASSAAIAGSASEPSTRTSRLFPCRGGNVPSAYASSDASRALLPADVPEPAAVPAAHGVVDPLAEGVAELDGRRLEEPGRLELARDRVRGPGRTPGSGSSSWRSDMASRRRPPEAPRARARPRPPSTRGPRACRPRSRCTPACRSARDRRG